MTPQEASEELKEEFEIFKNSIDPADWKYNNEELAKIIEANTMAIEVLGQQPCEDCISRQAVKEMLIQEWTGYMPMELDMNLSFVLDKISLLPSVTRETGHWIPVSERLPEEYGDYIITVKIEIYELKQYYEVVREAPFDGRNFDIGFMGDGVSVIAWMPLPEPYKAESEDE